MPVYRTPAPPQRLKREITLLPNRVRAVILGACLWALGAVLLALTAMWVLKAAILGEGFAWLIPAVLIPVALVAVIVPLLRFTTLYLSNVRLERQGFFRRVGIDWAEVTGQRRIERRQKNHRYVTVIILEGRGGAEFEFVPGVVADPDGVLPWAVEAAIAGDVPAIDERVRRDGRILVRTRQVLVHAMVALGIVGAFAWFFAPSVQRESLSQQMEAAREASPEERLALAPALLDHPAASRSTRCSVGQMVMLAHQELDDTAAATRACEETEAAGCEGPGGGCHAYFSFDRALALLAAVEGDDGGAAAALPELEALGGCHRVECFELRMRILRDLDREADALAVGRECIEAYGHLSPDSDMLAPCRP